MLGKHSLATNEGARAAELPDLQAADVFNEGNWSNFINPTFDRFPSNLHQSWPRNQPAPSSRSGNSPFAVVFTTLSSCIEHGGQAVVPSEWITMRVRKYLLVGLYARYLVYPDQRAEAFMGILDEPRTIVIQE